MPLAEFKQMILEQKMKDEMNQGVKDERTYVS